MKGATAPWIVGNSWIWSQQQKDLRILNSQSSVHEAKVSQNSTKKTRSFRIFNPTFPSEGGEGKMPECSESTYAMIHLHVITSSKIKGKRGQGAFVSEHPL